MSNEKIIDVRDDEIDLVQLVLSLWEGKWLILLGTLVSVAIGVLVALSLPKNYEYKTELTAAKAVDYNRMYTGKLKAWRPEEIALFEDAIDLFKSNTLAEKALIEIMPKGLVENEQLVWLDEQLRDKVKRSIQHVEKTTVNKKSQQQGVEYFNNSITLSYLCRVPENCKAFLNAWTALAHKQLVDTEVEKVTQTVADTVAQLSFNEKRMQDLHEINSSYYVKVFEEARQLAKTLGIRENQHDNNVFEMGEFLKEFKATTDPELNAENVKDNIENLGLRTPLYLYGTQTLGAIIDALNLRKQDTGFIEALAKTRYEIDEWEAVDLNPEGVKFFRVVSRASPVNVKSNRKVIVLAMAFIGLLISMVVVLTRSAIKARKTQVSH